MHPDLGGEHLGKAEFFSRYIRKSSLAYTAVLSIIMLFECFMIIRGVFVFDFSRVKHRIYMASYRIGGDEFALLLEPEDRAALEEKIRAINAALEKRFPGRSVSISAGFCLQGGGTAAAALVNGADGALYAAKNGGKRRCCFASGDAGDA